MISKRAKPPGGAWLTGRAALLAFCFFFSIVVVAVPVSSFGEASCSSLSLSLFEYHSFLTQIESLHVPARLKSDGAVCLWAP
jgi:ABC-type Fe3+ transport system permease subunit